MLALLLALGLVPLTGTTAEALAGPAHVTVSVFGYGTVSTGNGGPTCASSPANSQSAESDCASFDPAPFDTCTSDGSGNTECTVLLTVTEPDPAGWHFTGWSGDCSGTSTTCELVTSEQQCDIVAGKPHCTDLYADVQAVAHFADDRPPVPVFTTAPAADRVVYDDSRTQQFAFTDDEPAEAPVHACRRDSGPFVGCVSPVTWSDLSDGVHTFCVRATDPSGRVGTTCRTWEQEVWPTLTILTHPAGYTQTAGPVSFTYTSNKAGHPADGSTLSYRCRLDDAAYAVCPAAGTSFSWVPNGGHTFTVQADFHGTDDLPGLGPVVSSSYTWTQSDNTGPTVTWSTRGGLTTTPPTEVAWTSDGAGDEFRCAFDEPAGSPGAREPCSSPYRLPDLPDGVHTVTVEARDPIGNARTDTWSVDVEHPPAARITSGPAPGASIGGPAVTFGFGSDRAHVRFLCALDGGALGPCTDPAGAELLGGLAAGRHTLRVLPRYESPLGGTLDGVAVTRDWTSVLLPSCSVRVVSTKVRHQRARFEVTCSATSTATVAGTLKVRVPHRRSRTLATRVTSVHLDAGRPTVVSVRLTRFQLKALRHHWRVRGSFRVVALDLAGPGTAATAKVRLR
jgi:hypothetical protein